MEEKLGGSHIIIEVVACSMERIYGGAREWGLGKEGKRIGFDVGRPKPCVGRRSNSNWLHGSSLSLYRV